MVPSSGRQFEEDLLWYSNYTFKRMLTILRKVMEFWRRGIGYSTDQRSEAPWVVSTASLPIQLQGSWNHSNIKTPFGATSERAPEWAMYRVRVLRFAVGEIQTQTHAHRPWYSINGSSPREDSLTTQKWLTPGELTLYARRTSKLLDLPTVTTPFYGQI